MEKRPPLPYKSLIQFFAKQGIKNIGYEDLLWTDEWLYFRNQIKYRDNETCTNCSVSQYRKMSDEEFEEELKLSGFGKYYNMLEGTFEDEPSEHNFKFNVQYPSQLTIDNSVQLEVHHKYYIWNKLPWEYDKDALTTLCVSCHKDEHFGKRRIVYTDDTLTRKKILQSCLRCNGSGYLSEYNHVQNGICFACGGYGGVIEGTEKNSFKI